MDISADGQCNARTVQLVDQAVHQAAQLHSPTKAWRSAAARGCMLGTTHQAIDRRRARRSSRTHLHGTQRSAVSCATSSPKEARTPTSQQAEMRRLRGAPTKRSPAEWMLSTAKGVGRRVQRHGRAGTRVQGFRPEALSLFFGRTVFSEGDKDGCSKGGFFSQGGGYFFRADSSRAACCVARSYSATTDGERVQQHRS